MQRTQEEQLSFYKAITIEQLLLINVADTFHPAYSLPNWFTTIQSNLLARKCKIQYKNIQDCIYTLEVILNK